MLILCKKSFGDENFTWNSNHYKILFYIWCKCTQYGMRAIAHRNYNFDNFDNLGKVYNLYNKDSIPYSCGTWVALERMDSTKCRKEHSRCICNTVPYKKPSSGNMLYNNQDSSGNMLYNNHNSSDNSFHEYSIHRNFDQYKLNNIDHDRDCSFAHIPMMDRRNAFLVLVLILVLLLVLEP